jgi:hypothetical protein
MLPVTATPNIAQFVVINGRYMPSALYSEGINFFSTISSNCTIEAITRIKVNKLKYGISSGTKTKLYSSHEIVPAKNITTITDKDIPIAEERFFDTPIKEHIPKN